MDLNLEEKGEELEMYEEGRESVSIKRMKMMVREDVPWSKPLTATHSSSL